MTALCVCNAHLHVLTYRLCPLPRSGELLDLSLDLGWRLLPGFDTATGLPYHRVNLQHGVDEAETHETCTAAAGTLYMEFALLSKLSGAAP